MKPESSALVSPCKLMQVNLTSLNGVLLQNVAEVKFNRRRPKPGQPQTRRMLCTNSAELLNSAAGRTSLNYRPPVKAPKYNPSNKNLIITWDIFMQGYRTINVDSCTLINVIPANDQFWTYFNEKLVDMPQDQKIAFMNV